GRRGGEGGGGSMGKAPRLRGLDAEIGRELQEALGDFSAQEALGEPEKGKPQPAQPGEAPGRKKGKIIAVHGSDVFVQVPGGRSEGVLPLEQFEGQTPAGGSEGEGS